MTESEKDSFCRHVLALVQRLRDVQLGLVVEPTVVVAESGALAGVQYEEPRRPRVVRRRRVAAQPAPVPRPSVSRPTGPNPLIVAPVKVAAPMQWTRTAFDPEKARARAGEGV